MKRGSNGREARSPAAVLVQGRRRSDRWVRPDWWGPRVSERGQEMDTVSVKGVPGPRDDSDTGPKGSPGSFSYFSFSFSFLFLFSNSFITFSNLVQIDSNQLCKVSKIQNNNP
jgi:hypothetical protein